MMNFILTHLDAIIVAVVFICGGFVAVWRFMKLPKSQQIAQIRGWLLQAVILAEREFGGGTGRVKLSSVYDKFLTRFPWLAKVITFDSFSTYVAEVLVDAENLMKSNAAVAAIVDGEKATQEAVV